MRWAGQVVRACGIKKQASGTIPAGTYASDSTLLTVSVGIGPDQFRNYDVHVVLSLAGVGADLHTIVNNTLLELEQTAGPGNGAYNADGAIKPADPSAHRYHPMYRLISSGSGVVAETSFNFIGRTGLQISIIATADVEITQDVSVFVTVEGIIYGG